MADGLERAEHADLPSARR